MVIDLSETTLTEHKAVLISEWLEANAEAPGWIGGYPLGGSYIDARAKAGARSDGRQNYVDLDHDTARKVPELRGFYARDIREFMDARTEMADGPTVGLR